jgi:ubiquinone biosynthesis monooxygenase Coq7
MRRLSFADQLFIRLDTALKLQQGSAHNIPRPNPSQAYPETPIFHKQSAALMRINHTGEVCAQALYQGQRLTARDPALAAQFQQAAFEESDHLRWCESRLHELGSHTSLLNPFWYTASLALGVGAGLLGDGWSLGFLAETERQVTRHLEGHLERLPPDDLKSRAIVFQMKQEEQKHAYQAEKAGAYPLPLSIKVSMQGMAWVMKKVVAWV